MKRQAENFLFEPGHRWTTKEIIQRFKSVMSNARLSWVLFEVETPKKKKPAKKKKLVKKQRATG